MMHTLRVLWCRAFHRSLMFAGGRIYHCSVCRMQFAVPWAKEEVR